MARHIVRTNPSTGRRRRGVRRNPPIALQSHVGMLQQDVAMILDRAGALSSSARFRYTSQGGLEFRDHGLGNRILKDKRLFERLRVAAASHGFDALPSGDGIVMLPFGVRTYTHRRAEAFDNPRKMSDREWAIHIAALKLILGKEILVTAPTSEPNLSNLLLGSVLSPRRDPYFVQSDAGRIYFEKPEHAAKLAVDYVGSKAVVNAVNMVR